MKNRFKGLKRRLAIVGLIASFVAGAAAPVAADSTGWAESVGGRWQDRGVTSGDPQRVLEVVMDATNSA